jgi:hypothetical protein
MLVLYFLLQHFALTIKLVQQQETQYDEQGLVPSQPTCVGLLGGRAMDSKSASTPLFVFVGDAFVILSNWNLPFSFSSSYLNTTCHKV